MTPQANQMQTVLTNAEQFSPPFRELLPSGDLGPEYGPPSPSALARRFARHNNWAYRPIPRRAKVADEATAQALWKFMHNDRGERRTDVSPKQTQVYEHLFLRGHSVRWTARKMRIRRETVKAHARRLLEKAGLRLPFGKRGRL